MVFFFKYALIFGSAQIFFGGAQNLGVAQAPSPPSAVPDSPKYRNYLVKLEVLTSQLFTRQWPYVRVLPLKMLLKASRTRRNVLYPTTVENKLPFN